MTIEKISFQNYADTNQILINLVKFLITGYYEKYTNADRCVNYYDVSLLYEM
jgi:hypothetical protein